MRDTRSRSVQLAYVVLGVLAPLAGIACGADTVGTAANAGVGFGAEQQLRTTIVRVVDGDTIVVALADTSGKHEKVRLIGIDTPETKKPNTPIECYGPEASARLHDLLPAGAAITLERDAEERDVYGRLLAYVHRADGLFVNEAMVTEGFAATLSIAPNVAHRDQLRADVDAARANRRGLWGACAGPHATAPP